MGLLNDAAVVNIEGNTKQLVDQINKADKAMQGFDKTLTDILSHLTAVENGLKNVNGTTQNFTKNYKGNFFNAPTNSFVGARGTAANYTDTKSSAYQQAQNKYIQTQKKNLELLDKEIEKEMEITRLKKEQSKVVQQDALSRSRNSQAKLLRAQAANTSEMLSYYAGLGLKHNELKDFYKYKSAHPERFIAGAQDWNPRYQGSKAIRGLGEVASNFGMGGKLVGSLLDSLGTFVKSPIAGTATAVTNLAQSVVDLGKSAVQSYSEIEAIKTQLGVVFSNQTQANSMFGQISEYAVHSPFGVQQTSELAVLLKQSGVYASDLMDTLKMLGDTAGGNMEKMKRIANNYAQIVSIGKASMLDMRQFAYAGIPIFEAVSKELGVSQQQLRKLISEGKVTSDIVEKVFKDLTGINGIFENATEKGAKTLKARLQNLSDARQLAMGSVGQWIVNSGTKTGNDSYANKIVSGIENIYSWLQEHVDTNNIQSDVKTIANREDRIQKLESLIEYNKVWGTPDIVAGLEKMLAQEMSKRDPDKDRATWVEAYKNARSEYDKLFESGEVVKLNELEIKIKEQEDKISKMTGNAVGKFGATSDASALVLGLLSGNLGSVVSNLISLEGRYNRVQGDETIGGAKEYLKYLEDLKKAILGSNEIQKEWIQAMKEQTVIDAQQLAFDQANKFADTKQSLNYSFNELYEIWKDSDEQKEKAEQERLERLKSAQEILKQIADNTDELGNLDITTMTRSEYQDYKNRGAFTGERKLNVVEGKNASQLSADRELLEKQFAHNVGVIIDEIMKSPAFSSALGQNMVGAVNSSFMKLAGTTTDEAFFKQFAVTFTEISSSLDEMAKYDQTNANFYKSLKEYLTDATIQWNLKKEGANADLSEQGKSKSVDMFIPLWKRILSSATGLTTNGMTSTQQTMTNYRDDMAIRNMASGVLSATMKSMGIDTAMSLMRTNRSVQLTGDNGKTYQIDWAETKKAMHNFAIQLSTSTEVITAYKNGLQAELDTYEQLIAAGYTQAESTDFGSQKFVSSKQLAKLGLGNESQLVNAFGEILTTASGKQYNVADVTFKNGQMFDKVGKPIEEEVVITGKLFEFIKGELPRLREEIHQANVAELNNSVIKQMFDNISATTLMSKFISSGNSLKAAQFINSNPEYVNSYINSALSMSKEKNSALKKLSNSDILLKAYDYDSGKYEENKKRIEELNAKGQTKEAKELAEQNIKLLAASVTLEEIFKWLAGDIESLTNTDAYKKLIEGNRTQERDSAVNAELLKIGALLEGERYNSNNPENNKRLYTYSGDLITSATQLKPENYAGKRGTKNRILDFFFGSQDYDIEDLYLAAAKTANIEGKSVNQFGIDASRFQNMSDEDILGAEGLDNAEKQMIKIKSLAADVVKTFGEFREQVSGLARELGKKAFITPFEKMGECLVNGKDWGEEMGKAMEQLGAEALSALGPLMQQAGMALVEMGAKKGNWGIVLAGLGLAAAGGFAAGIGGALSSAENNEDDNDKEAEKIESLKDELEKLLEQARSDALYYEHNLRHKTALGINKGFSHQSVNDAIITPQGKVVTTDPKDYLIATKTPNQLVGGGAGVTVSPVINCNVVNNTSSKVTQQQRQNADGSIDIVTMIEDAVGEYIASPRSDNAFESREYRLSSQQMVM